MLCASLVSTVSAHGVYEKYNTEGWSQPIISVLMQGLAHDGSPWKIDDKSGDGSSLLADSQTNTGELPDALAGQSDLTITGNSLTGQSGSGSSDGSAADSAAGLPGTSTDSSAVGGSASGQPGSSSTGDPAAGATGSSAAGSPTAGQPDSSAAGDPAAGQPDSSSAGDPAAGQPGSSSAGNPANGAAGSSSAGNPAAGAAGSSSAGDPAAGQPGSSVADGSSSQAGSNLPGHSPAGQPNATGSPDPSAASPEEPKQYAFTEVTQEYFDDALFIGDSRVAGVQLYSGWDNLTYYAENGMTIYNLFQSKTAKENGKTLTIEEALQQRSFGKIYLEIGINEMGTGTVDSFMEAYEEAVGHLRELQPDAILYVCGIMYVKQSKSESDPIFNNPNIQARNDRIAGLADGESIFYLDINEVVTDETGNLNPDYTWDEVHLLGKYDTMWLDYFCSHGIVRNCLPITDAGL